jgi:hypothetical protein
MDSFKLIGVNISNLYNRIVFKLNFRGNTHRQKLSREAEDGDTAPRVYCLGKIYDEVWDQRVLVYL